AGPFGPCAATSRLDFSTLRQTGVYRIKAAGVTSLPVRIGDDVYRAAADSLLAYLREQRSGYNPVFRDSVHHRSDGVLVDHPTRSGEFIPVSGGWADASDYLQYGATTAHATTMLLLAYRDHPGAFADRYQANGLPGANGIPDVLDEARWAPRRSTSATVRSPSGSARVRGRCTHSALRIPACVRRRPPGGRTSMRRPTGPTIWSSGRWSCTP